MKKVVKKSAKLNFLSNDTKEYKMLMENHSQITHFGEVKEHLGLSDITI